MQQSLLKPAKTDINYMEIITNHEDEISPLAFKFANEDESAVSFIGQIDSIISPTLDDMGLDFYTRNYTIIKIAQIVIETMNQAVELGNCLMQGMNPILASSMVEVMAEVIKEVVNKGKKSCK